MSATSGMVGTDDIELVPRELGVTVYTEIIVITIETGDALVPVNTACGVCTSYSGFAYLRELIVPTDAATLRAALTMLGYRPAEFTPYTRNFNTNVLTAAEYSAAVSNRQSLVFVSTELSDGQLAAALSHLGASREVLPARLAR